MGYRLRFKHRKKHVSMESSLFPEQKTFLRRYACAERHPGLCYTRDVDVYKNTLQLATSIERLVSQHVSRFISIEGGTSADMSDIVLEQSLFVCEHRGRRSFAPQSVVLACCSSRLR